MSRSDVEPTPGTDGERPLRIRARRWRRWLVLVVAATVVYWVASYAARPLAESWLSRTLGAQVELRRVGFDPIDAVVTLEGLVAYLPESSRWASGPIVADRARVDLQWFPLIHRRIQVRELALESAVLDLDRLPTTIPGLQALQTASAPETLPKGWTLQIDRLALRESLLRIGANDPTTVPLVVSVRDAEVIATRRRTSVLGAATNLVLDARFEGGTLRAEGHYALRPEGLAVTADVRASDLPVSRLLERLPVLDMEHLSGRLGGEMRYVLDSRRNSLSGWARLRDASMNLPDRSAPTFEVRNAIADVESIDFDSRSVRIRSLVLRGTTLSPEAGIASTVLTSLAAESSSRRGARSGGEQWRWAVDQLDATDARLRFVGPGEPVEVIVNLRGENLGPRSHWSPVHASLSYGSASAAFEGSVRTSYDEPRLEGRLTAGGIDLPALVREVKLPGAHLVTSGLVTANVDVFLEPSRGGFGVAGTASLDRVAVTGVAEPPREEEGNAGAAAAVGAQPTPPLAGEAALGGRFVEEPHPPRTFALGADRIDLRIDAPAPPRLRQMPPPVQHWVVDATLVHPFLQVSRDRRGWILPSLAPPPAPAAAYAPTPSAEPTPEAASEPRIPPLPLTIRYLTVRDGHLLYYDGAAAPLLAFDVRQIHGEALRLRPSPLVVSELSLDGRDAALGTLGIRGFDVSAREGIEIFGEGIELDRIEPYLERLGLPYRFTGGTASFSTAMRHEARGWTADTLLVLSDPRIDPWTEDDIVPELLGMSLSAALDLLRDQHGDVRLHLPHLDNLHQEFGLAIHDAVQHAHEAPVSGGALTPTPVDFAPGQTTLRPDSVAWLRSVARMVNTHPLLRIELTAPASLQDRRWVAEQDVLRRLEDRSGLMDALSLLGVGDDYGQLRHGLRMRARGRTWDLTPYDEEVLGRLLAEQPPVSEARLRALGDKRLDAIEEFLRAQGVPRDRLTRVEMPGLDRTTLAAVLVTVRAEAPRNRRPAPTTREGDL